MTVEDNLAFSLKLHKMPKQEVQERVHRAASILQIEQLPEAQAARPLRRPAPARRDGTRSSASRRRS